MLQLAYASCSVSVAPLRAAPAHRAEQTSQLLFGERVHILKEDAHEWLRIRNVWDDYEGYVRKGQLRLLSKKEFMKASRYCVGPQSGKLLTEQADVWVPAGAELTGMKGGKLLLQDELVKYKGSRTAFKKAVLNSAVLRDAALSFLHTPYLWGGRTIAGIDCSGLVQLAYKLCAKAIPRDASQQALAGNTVDFLSEAKCGDLAFFDNDEGRIVHVGMLLDAHTIIHATEVAGRCVIDKIDTGGIISRIYRRRTHKLRLIKRLF